jgi:hypothetical protein
VTRESEPLILGAVVVWMLLVWPVAEDHYFSLYVLPAACALAALLSADRSKRRFGYAVLTVVGLLNVGSVIDRRFETYGAVFWGGLLLLFLLLYIARYEENLSRTALREYGEHVGND